MAFLPMILLCLVPSGFGRRKRATQLLVTQLKNKAWLHENALGRAAEPKEPMNEAEQTGESAPRMAMAEQTIGDAAPIKNKAWVHQNATGRAAEQKEPVNEAEQTDEATPRTAMVGQTIADEAPSNNMAWVHENAIGQAAEPKEPVNEADQSGEAAPKTAMVEQAIGDPAPIAASLLSHEACQEFFLLDGRDPVDLPGTWAEARSSFVDICIDELDGDKQWCNDRQQELFDKADAMTSESPQEVSLCGRLEKLGGTSSDSARLSGRQGKGGSYYSYYSYYGGGSRSRRAPQYKRGSGRSCPSGYNRVTSSSKCQEAASALSLSWSGTENDSTWPADCYALSSVYFNNHRADVSTSGDFICSGTARSAALATSNILAAWSILGFLLMP